MKRSYNSVKSSEMRTWTVVSSITVICLSLSLLLFGCSTTVNQPEQPFYKPITGSILIDDSIILRKSIAVEIHLLDITIPQEEPVAISKQIIKNPKKTPIQFSLRFDQDDILAFKTFIVRVLVYEGEELIYECVNDIPVLTKGNPDTIQIQLKQVY